MTDCNRANCPNHGEMTDAVSQMKGRWTVLLVVLCLSLLAGGSFLKKMDDNIEVIRESVTEGGQYISKDEQRTEDILRRLELILNRISDHEKRIRELETS